MWWHFVIMLLLKCVHVRIALRCISVVNWFCSYMDLSASWLEAEFGQVVLNNDKNRATFRPDGGVEGKGGRALIWADGKAKSGNQAHWGVGSGWNRNVGVGTALRLNASNACADGNTTTRAKTSAPVTVARCNAKNHTLDSSPGSATLADGVVQSLDGYRLCR